MRSRYLTAILTTAALLLGVGSASGASMTLNLQQGAAPTSGWASYSGAEDTQLHDESGQRGYQYGDATTIQVRDRFSDDDALLRFGMSQVRGNLNVNSIDSVTLRLTTSSTATADDNEFSVYLLGQMPADAAWIEGTGVGDGTESGGGSSYYWRDPAVSRWASGTFPTIGAAATGIVAVNTTANGTTDFTLNGTGVSAVEGWINGSTTNGGLLVVGRGNSNPGGDSGDTIFYNLHSKEASTVDYRPELIITGDFTTRIPDVVRVDLDDNAGTGSGDIPGSFTTATTSDWNVIDWGISSPTNSTATFTGASLFDVNGDDSGYSLTIAPATGMRLHPNFDLGQDTPAVEHDYAFLRTGDGHTSMTITWDGLIAGRLYDINMWLVGRPEIYRDSVLGDFLAQPGTNADNITLDNLTADGNGQIVLFLQNQSGFNDGGFSGIEIMAVAVPEPSTFALTAPGFLSLGCVGWRRRRRA